MSRLLPFTLWPKDLTRHECQAARLTNPLLIGPAGRDALRGMSRQQHRHHINLCLKGGVVKTSCGRSRSQISRRNIAYSRSPRFRHRANFIARCKRILRTHREISSRGSRGWKLSLQRRGLRSPGKAQSRSCMSLHAMCEDQRKRCGDDLLRQRQAQHPLR